MVNFKKFYHFSRFQRGSNIFQGGGGVHFFQGGGVQLLIPYSNQILLVIFQGGGPDPLSPPLDPHLPFVMYLITFDAAIFIGIIFAII